MTSASGNPSCASRYSVSSAVGGQKISHIQFVLRKPFQVSIHGKKKKKSMIRLCKTLLLAEVIRLFMSDDVRCKYRPSFFSEDLLFFAEEFIWKQRLGKNSACQSLQLLISAVPCSLPVPGRSPQWHGALASWRRLRECQAMQRKQLNLRSHRMPVTVCHQLLFFNRS